MIGLKRGTVQLLPYDNAWAALGEQYCSHIKSALGECAVSAAHVGSTSVPGLCAKPIIDIAVGVQSLDTQIIASLEHAGYIFRPSQDDRSNMLFVDGHATAMTPGDLGQTDWPNVGTNSSYKITGYLVPGETSYRTP